MSQPNERAENVLSERIRSLVYLEFELLERCREAISDPSLDPDRRAALLHLEGSAQEHIFDLDNALWSLGVAPASYSRCVRYTLSFGRSIENVLDRLSAAYARTARAKVPAAPLALLHLNLDDTIRAQNRLSVDARYAHAS